jgi:acyl-CoA reductase-like NAD-dependent aldehyde dehydrogenase
VARSSEEDVELALEAMGEVCTCPSRAMVHESIFDKFVEKAVARVARIKVGNPLDPATQMGPQCSHGQLEKILIMDAYETFGHAAKTHALKVVIEA